MYAGLDIHSAYGKPGVSQVWRWVLSTHRYMQALHYAIGDTSLCVSVHVNRTNPSEKFSKETSVECSLVAAKKEVKLSSFDSTAEMKGFRFINPIKNISSGKAVLVIEPDKLS